MTKHNPQKAKRLITDAMCQIDETRNTGWKTVNKLLRFTQKRIGELNE